ncbi:CobW family GTP-binding protein [Nonomuraea dietziae]|uniref:G3E family GTPase n=1 Tax=Nonomuraea dietziae TaxID=65515 RepID=A0A7W5V726_9ACTN|nr:GTP-binding protein [Nonomuraea dietziae]MBB3731731.1 G3E family GTPase [Nonomuraea dietziae]
MSVPVVLVSGLHAEARSTLVDRLLAEHPGSVAVHHDLGEVGAGRVERIVRDASGVLDRHHVRLAHGCVTCTVREDLIPELLARAAGSAPLLIAELWDSVEPRAVAEALAWHEDAAHALRVTGVLTAVDAEGLTEDLCCDERLATRGKRAAADDERYLAEVLTRQIEYATGIVVSGADQEDIELALTVLGHLVPTTPADVLALPEVTGRRVDVEMLAARVDPATAQLPCQAQTGEISTVVWHRLRPLHPQRLFDAVDELVTQTVRSRGRFWLANRHDRLLAWDAVAGVVSIEDAGPWLVALPEAAWELVSPARRMAATLDWNDILGDRVQHLVFTGPDLDQDRILSLLDSCLLTEQESLAGSDVWANYADPFAFVLDLKESTA